jgi:hypothetical protein
MSATTTVDAYRETRRPRIALLIGFVALTVAIVAARGAPADGHELSIYRGTPLLFWAGVAIAALIGVSVAVREPGGRRLTQAATVLTGTGILSVVGLPIVRGYYYYGKGDAMSHLGWVRMFETGVLHPSGMRYPAVHTISVLLSKAAALTPRHALMLTVVAFFAVFLLFVPLCVGAITDAGPAVLVGAVSALLLLPINNIGTHNVAYPTSQAILFVPVLLYLTMGYVLDRGDRHELWRNVSAVGLLLAVGTTAMVLLHPQQAVNLLGAFVLVALLQHLYRRFGSDHAIIDHRSLSFQTGLFAVVFFAWSLRLERVYVAATDILTGLVTTTTPGTAVASRSASLTLLGGSLEEMFVKLFGVSLVYAVLATAIALAALVGSVGRIDDHGTAFLQYLAVTGVPAAGFFAVFLLADAKTQYFRYHGFLMVVVTIMGAVALTVAFDRLGGLHTRPALATVVSAAFVAFLVLQVVAFHPSPYIYQPNPQVTEDEALGYETSLEHRDRDVAWTGIRSGPRRYVDLHYGTTTPAAERYPWRRGTVPERAFRRGTLEQTFDGPTYVPVTQADYDRETKLFGGFRYNEAGFDRLDEEAEIDRVHANDEFGLYLVEPEGGADA